MSNRLLLSLLVSVLIPACVSRIEGEAKPEVKASNAYRMELLDREDKPLATLTIWADEFEAREHSEYLAKSNLILYGNRSKEEDVLAFKSRIPNPGVGKVEIVAYRNESPNQAPEQADIRHQINLSPGASDYNIDVCVDVVKSKVKGNGFWGWQSAGGGFSGGDVKISRIFSEQVAGGQPATRPESKPDGNQ